MPDMTLPSTRKLYWADPLRRHFTARVLRRQPGAQPSVILNRTLFYPTGGGQPHDTGRLGDAHVLGVEQRDGLIHHFLDHLPEGDDEITGEIDWPRRWDHMQQHSGQHLLSAAFLTLLDRPTIGFHLSPDSLTIDLPGSPPDRSHVTRILDFTTAIITEDRPIHTYTVAPDQISRIPLRKPPQVDGPVRIVEIAQIDWSACGGTHVPRTAAIGSLIIQKIEKRGDATRVHFLAGGRAQTDHLHRLGVTQTLTDQLTTSLDDLPAACDRLRSDLDRTQKALKQAETQLLAAEAARLWAQAPLHGGIRLIRQHLPADASLDPRRLLSAALALGDCVAVIGRVGTPARWAAGRADAIDLDLRPLLPTLQTLPGVRGGGSVDLIQGTSDPDYLSALLDTLTTALIGQLDVRTRP